MSERSPKILLSTGLALLTALGDGISTFGGKLASDNAIWMRVTVLLSGFVLAAFAEILLPQRFVLARTCIFIIGVDPAFIFAAALWLGDSTLAGATPRRRHGHRRPESYPCLSPCSGHLRRAC